MEEVVVLQKIDLCYEFVCMQYLIHFFMGLVQQFQTCFKAL